MSDVPIVFMDTEATGLLPDDEVWEFAGLRRNPDGSTEDLHLFIEHNEGKAQRLPVPFYRDWLSRFPRPTSSVPDDAVDRMVAAWQIQQFTLGAHIIGAVPSFDAEKLSALMRRQGVEPKWHYHLCDIENVVVGFLAAKGQLMRPPWNSEALSRAVGVDPSRFARHTAMGDVLWVQAQWDAVMVGAA
jgi:hypothetical protein